jgi:ABC-type amino acid transport substrate-binding protein
MADLAKLNVVIANNFGHLPMFIGAEKGYFKQHGVDASFRVVDTGTDMVNALHNGEAQVGDMSTTTYLKAVHAGNPFQVIGLIMNDATNDRCDTPLAIVTKKSRGINVGKIGDLKGKKVGLARGQTSDEYFKMVLRRAGVKYEDVTIENIWSQFGLAPALAEGKVDAIVTWEPYVTQALTQVPDSYEVIRGGQHMSYVMVAVAHGPTVESKPGVIKSIAAGLAQSSPQPRRGGGDFRQVGARHRCCHRQESDQEHQLRSSHVPERSAGVRECRGRSADKYAKGRAAAQRTELVPPGIHGRGAEGAPGIFRGFAEAVGVAPHPEEHREAMRLEG